MVRFECGGALFKSAAAKCARWQTMLAVMAIFCSLGSANCRADEVVVAGLSWHTDYYAAYNEAAADEKLLLINFVPSGQSAIQQSIDDALPAREELTVKLTEFVLCRLPVDTEIDIEGQPTRLLACDGFRELADGPGFVIVDLANSDESHYRHVVSALPYASGKYYRWSIQGLSVAVDLPSGSLSQRTMIWAVRMHPERPRSTAGAFHPALAGGATAHAAYQARAQLQGHQNFAARSRSLSAATGGAIAEVCAESWPGQSLIDSCIDCVASWRHSSGHWRGVSRPHRAYGYDIRRGRNGIWYGTGLFAD